MSKKNQSTFMTLFASIAGRIFKPPTRRAIVAKPAKRPLPPYAEPPTTHQPSVLFVDLNYPPASNDGRRAIVLPGASQQRQSVGSGRPSVLPLNSGVKLSRSLALGRTYHPLCRQAFVERVTIGYYAYERRTEWRTCALAAAYAGVFGPAEIERPEFSYSQACWLLGQVLGYDPAKLIVPGPTGRRLPVAEEMIALTDQNLWTRRAVAAWLGSVGL